MNSPLTNGSPTPPPGEGLTAAQYLWHVGLPDAGANFETIALPLSIGPQVAALEHRLGKQLEQFHDVLWLLPKEQWHAYIGPAAGLLAAPADPMPQAFEMGFTQAMLTTCSVRLIPTNDESMRAVARALHLPEREQYGLTVAYARQDIDVEKTQEILRIVQAALAHVPIASSFERVELRASAPQGYRTRHFWALN